MNTLAELLYPNRNVTSPITRAQLRYVYRTPSRAEDDRAIRGYPDRALLNREEWYEVLDFVNSFATKHGSSKTGVALEAERLIKTSLPGYVRSHQNVEAWLLANWVK